MIRRGFSPLALKDMEPTGVVTLFASAVSSPTQTPVDRARPGWTSILRGLLLTRHLTMSAGLYKARPPMVLLRNTTTPATLT